MAEYLSEDRTAEKENKWSLILQNLHNHPQEESGREVKTEKQIEALSGREVVGI